MDLKQKSIRARRKALGFEFDEWFMDEPVDEQWNPTAYCVILKTCVGRSAYMENPGQEEYHVQEICLNGVRRDDAGHCVGPCRVGGHYHRGQ